MINQLTNNIKHLQLCLEGNQMAQLHIYNAYYKAMYNTAYRIIRHSEDAEDIMQESFITAFSKLSTLNDFSLFGAWLKRIVINTSLNHYKKNSRLNETPIESHLYKLEDSSVSLEAIDTTEAKVAYIIKAINSLKSNYKIALTLHLIEGYDYEEVSEILNISYANSRTTISRAKEKLREQLITTY